LNAGILIANNGFMIKNSPRENRTMFIAAGTGFAGIVGGAASIAAGGALAASDQWSIVLAGTEYVNFHVLFAASMVLRLASALLATFIREPTSAATRVVAGEIIVATRVRVRSWQLAIVGQRASPTVELRHPVRISSEQASRTSEPQPPLRRAA
jgi:hypothetical protein